MYAQITLIHDVIISKQTKYSHVKIQNPEKKLWSDMLAPEAYEAIMKLMKGELEKKQFIGVAQLIDVVLPDDIETIPEEAFFNCINLKSITVKPKTTNIESAAFQYCYNLENIICKHEVSAANDTFLRTIIEKKLPENIVMLPF